VLSLARFAELEYFVVMNACLDPSGEAFFICTKSA
jgi:hypothetical protein